MLLLDSFLLFMFWLIEIYSNCGVWLKNPKKTDIIFRYEYKKGKDLEIFYYDDISDLTKSSDFKKIGNDRTKVNNLIINYYNQLNLDQKSKFDKNVEIDELINSENYYFYENSTAIKNNDRYVLMIADKHDNKLYYIHIREWNLYYIFLQIKRQVDNLYL